VVAWICSVILVANTAYSSRQSFVAQRELTDASPVPLDLLAVARGLAREFDYVFGRFLPGDPERQARIIALAMCAFEHGQLLGRSRAVTLSEESGATAFAMVAPSHQPPGTSIKTVLAFVFATACCAATRLPATLWRAWKQRSLLFPAGTAEPAQKVLYLVVDPARRRQGVGSALLRRIDQLVATGTSPRVVAAVRSNNHAARTLFLKGGYRKVAKQQVLIAGAEERGGLNIYERTLAPEPQPVAALACATPASMGRRIVQVAAPACVVLASLAGILVARTWLVVSRQPSPAIKAVPAMPPAGLTAALSNALTFRSLSVGNTAIDLPATTAMSDLVAFLSRTYPALALEPIGARAHLVRIPGRSHDLPAILLYAHLDVVPADPAGWTTDAFGGTISDGQVYGRGALDDKFSAVAILAAAQDLVTSGWMPERPVYVALGHDEELDGTGAQAIARRLREGRVQLGSVLDEGGAIVDGAFPGLSRPVAAVAVAEKGYLDVALCARGAPGHSSAPPETTPIGLVSAAVYRLERNPPPTALNPLLRQTLTFAAAEMSYPWRMMVSNLWLTGPLVESRMRRAPLSRALLGSSQAATLIAGGIKSNILPDRACATLNYRLFPGSTGGDMLRRIRKVVDDPRVEITAGVMSAAPTPSSLDSVPGVRLAEVIRHHFRDAVVVPTLSPGTTDSRHFARLADQIFRFSPVHLDGRGLASLHGDDERISIAALGKAYSFYHSYLQHASRR